MKHNVPIYLADVTVQKIKKTFSENNVLEEKTLKKIIVKGFNFEDIIKRKKLSFIKDAFPKGLNEREDIIIKKINLLSQHGFGVDE